MYLYYDENFALKEVINDRALVQYDGNEVIHCFFENYSTATQLALVTGVSLTAKLIGGSFSALFHTASVPTATASIPYNPKRDLKWFSYDKDYYFFDFNTISGGSSLLQREGNYYANPIITLVDSASSPIVCQAFTFPVASNSIAEDPLITQSQYAYLLNLVSGYVKRNDLNRYLPLVGGTMTGNVTFTETGAQYVSVISNEGLRVNNQATLKNTYYGDMAIKYLPSGASQPITINIPTPSSDSVFALTSDITVVSKTDFDNASPSLNGITIAGTSYKVPIAGNASGINSVASGANSTASGGASTASGAFSTASGPYSTASGDSSTASGYFSTASGYFSTASGAYSFASITHEYSILSYESNLPSTNTPTFTTNSIDKVFFANLSDGEAAWTTYTSFSQFAKGHYLSEYIGKNATATITETIANIVAGTSDYFTLVSGDGTSASPYVIGPRFSNAVPHAHNIYSIALTSGGKYISFQASNNEKCQVKITSTVSSTDVVSFKNMGGQTRCGISLLSGTPSFIQSLPVAVIITAYVDINSPDAWSIGN